MKTIEIEYLIEMAEQASDPQEIESGKKARKELTALLAALAAQQSGQRAACPHSNRHLDNKFYLVCDDCGERI